MQYRQHERGERENCCGASEGVGGADGGRARVEGCGEDAVLVERALGVRFLKFCRSAGAESSEIPEVAVRLFLESLPVGGSAQDFAREQARMALDVFVGEMVGWSWCEDRYGRVGPKFRLKTNSAGLTTEDTGARRGFWPKIELMEWNRHGSRTARRAIPTLGFRWALPRRGQSGTRSLSAAPEGGRKFTSRDLLRRKDSN